MTCEIITLATTKGGAGKTTISLSLISYFLAKGKKVAALDTDINKNLTHWLEKGMKRDSFPSLCYKSEHDEQKIFDAIDNLQEDAEVIVIDMAGVSNKTLIYAMGASSLIVIPSKSSEDDVLEALKTRSILKDVNRLVKREIPYRVVLSQINPGTIVLDHAIQQFKAFDVSLLPSIPQRTIYQQSRFNASSPYLSGDKKAVAEINDLGDAVANILNITFPSKNNE